MTILWFEDGYTELGIDSFTGERANGGGALVNKNWTLDFSNPVQ